jgi:cytoskeleton protein RodZ
MTEQLANPTAAPPSAPPRAASTAGGMLRAAREAMGMSLDTVAQQLKLAPRQVTALEEDDFAKLPGRTFVRGFLRNYARLVRIDAEKVLAALPGGDAPALGPPALQPTAPTIGHLPTMEYAKPGWTRWAIPLMLVAVIAAAAIYEFSRGRSDAQQTPATAPGAIEPERASPPKPTAGANESPLPNPIGTPQAPATDPGATESAGAAAGAAPGPTLTPTRASPPADVQAGEVTIVLTYHDSAWTEVRDGRGKVLVSQRIPGGQTRSIAGLPPLAVVVRNPGKVSATLRGQQLNLVPVTQKNVARFVVE